MMATGVIWPSRSGAMSPAARGLRRHVLRDHGQVTMPADPAALLRSRAYLQLLVFAAILGVPISAAVYGFLALASYLQKEVYIHLPHGLGYATAPAWWPLPMLLVGAVLAALAIQYLPGHGGPSPAGGFKLHGPPAPIELPGVILAALATLTFGMVLGPEMPSILIGGGLAVLAIRLIRRNLPAQATSVLAASGSFAGVNALLGNPLVGAFLLMEASGLGGPMLILVLLPGLLAAGVGTLIFVGLDNWTGLGTFSLAIPGLPHISGITVGEFGWALVIGVAAAPIGSGIRWLARFLYPYAERWLLLALPVAGLVIGGLAVGYAEATGQPSTDVLFSGQSALPHLVEHASSYTVGALLLVMVCKGLGYGISLGNFRGGPVFPAMFIGAAGGIAMSHLPGLPLVAGVAMGIGAMAVVMLTLPLTSVLLASLLVASDAIVVMPLVIVAVVVAHVTAARLAPPAEPDKSGTGPAQPGAAAKAADQAA
jgi:H+/Cl- antiporter ClcA